MIRSEADWPGLVERPARGGGDWPEGVLAVLVHGTMDRGAGMAQLARRLRDAPTLRYDRRGYGRACGLGTTDLVGHVDDLIGLVGGRPAVLFGHSFGGLVALGAAATRRLDVRGIATWEAPTPWIAGWDGWTIQRMSDEGAEAAEHFMRSTVGATTWESLPERTREARRLEGPALLADMDPTLTVGVPFDPARIGCRCVLGVGDVSAAPYSEGAQWLVDRLADARRRLLVGATHSAPMRRAGDVAELIRATLARDDDARWRESDGASV